MCIRDRCDVVEADLSINQIIIEINQFAAGVRHLDGNVDVYKRQGGE